MGEVVLTIARSFPKCTVHGYDISARSLELAKQRWAPPPAPPPPPPPPHTHTTILAR